jgi:hypothetical protein
VLLGLLLKLGKPAQTVRGRLWRRWGLDGLAQRGHEGVDVERLEQQSTAQTLKMAGALPHEARVGGTHEHRRLTQPRVCFQPAQHRPAGVVRAQAQVENERVGLYLTDVLERGRRVRQEDGVIARLGAELLVQVEQGWLGVNCRDARHRPGASNLGAALWTLLFHERMGSECENGRTQSRAVL